MPEFKCTNCKYKFRPSGWDIKNKCPYCGRDGTLTTEDNPGIDDVDDFLR